MNKKSLLLLPVTALLLTSCVGNTHYSTEQYMINVEWKRPTFRILQLGDVHFSITDNYQEHFDVMQKTINNCNPDLIVLNGDAFTFASKQTVATLFTWLDTRKHEGADSDKPIYWTFTFGNHDDQGQYADTWIPREMSSGKYQNCVCPDLKMLENDDVTGRTNFVLNLHKNNELKYQVFIFDSNSYNFKKYDGIYKEEGYGYYYDSIKEDQVEWYKRMVQDTTDANSIKGLSKNQNSVVKSSAFFHIPLPQFQDALNLINNQPINYETKYGIPSINVVAGDGAEELVSAPQTDTGLFEAMMDLGSTQSVSCAHDHVNNFVCECTYNYDGSDKTITFAYGMHATNRIYYAKDKIGGQVIEVNEDGTITFENKYTENDYPEVQLL